MPVLARAKRRVAAGIQSGAMHADSRQTDFCTYLSAILLGGLLLHLVAGWWWADPVAGLAMVPIMIKEGLSGLRGRALPLWRRMRPGLGGLPPPDDSGVLRLRKLATQSGRSAAW